VFGCSGTPRGVGANATTSLRFCGDVLCTIDLIVVPESEESNAWLQEFQRFQASLEKKYGPPAEKEQEMPPECRDDILTCLRDGTAWLRQKWDFEDHSSITFRMSNKRGPDAAIRISYATGSAGEGLAL
jgi:hypothetical protein